jgi:sodium transport system permease protein
VFSLVALSETSIGFSLLPRLVPVDALGIPLRLDGSAVFASFLLALPLTLLASSAQMIVATFSSSFKEAQTYLSMLVMVPLFPGMFLAAVPLRPALRYMFIPSFAEQLLIGQLLRGESIPWVHVLAAMGSTTCAAIALILLTIRLYQGERVLFGKS